MPWCGSRAWWYEGVLPAITTIGVQSAAAVTTPVSALVMPGEMCTFSTASLCVTRK